jgi:hypothetical protein
MKLQDARHLLTAGALLGAVLGTLALGAALQQPPVGRPTAPAAQDSAPAELPSEDLSQPLSADDAPEPAPLERQPPRAEGWTLQFMVACNAESVGKIEQQLGGDPRLYLLPLVHQGQPCHRICWGQYRSRELALAESSLPAPLLQINREPIPRRIDDLIP